MGLFGLTAHLLELFSIPVNKNAKEIDYWSVTFFYVFNKNFIDIFSCVVPISNVNEWTKQQLFENYPEFTDIDYTLILISSVHHR